MSWRCYRAACWILLSALLCAACSEGEDGVGPDQSPPEEVAATIGPSGGVLEHPAGAWVEIPRGSFSDSVHVTILAVTMVPTDSSEASGTFRVSVARTSQSGSEFRAAGSSSAGQYSVGLRTTAASSPGEVVIEARLQGSNDVYYARSVAVHGSGRELVTELWAREDGLPITLRALYTLSGSCGIKYKLIDTGVPEDPPGGERPVVVIHGLKPFLFTCLLWWTFDSRETGQELRAHLNAAGLGADLDYWHYTYPTFNPIDNAASDLADPLSQEFAGRTDVVLVGHSMGGLVARAAVERHGADAVVSTVISLGTPHAGAEIADPLFWTAWLGVDNDQSRDLHRRFPFLRRGLSLFPLNTQGVRDLLPADRGGTFIGDINRSEPAGSDYFTFGGRVIWDDLESPCGHGLLTCRIYKIGFLLYELAGIGPSDGLVRDSSAFLEKTKLESDLGLAYDHSELLRGNYSGARFPDPTKGDSDPVLSRVAEIIGGPVEPPVAFKLQNVSAGNTQTCGVDMDGAAYCWGNDASGQLGNGPDKGQTPRPDVVAGGLVYSLVSAGSGHTCGITADRRAYCWGWNYWGQLGDGSRTSSQVPAEATGGLSFIDVSVGDDFTCGVTEGYLTYCWGTNGSGQLGDGSQSSRSTPSLVQGGHRFVAVSAGGSHTCGISETGAAYCWGGGGSGRLGTGSSAGSTVPVPAQGDLLFKSIAAGASHTCGITVDDDAYCWGSGSFGQVGDGEFSMRLTPVPVIGQLKFLSIGAGGWHTCGVATDHAAYCWGYNGRGQLGIGSTSNQNEPSTVAGSIAFQSVSAGIGAINGHTCGVADDGSAYCWGSGAYGMIGDGFNENRLVPTAVAEPAAAVVFDERRKSHRDSGVF